jgi:hypothetical protein
MLWFQLKRRGHRTKWRQQTRLGFMGKKRDTTRRGDNVGWRGKREDDTSWTIANLTGSKMKKIHTVDSAATNDGKDLNQR